MKDHFGTELAIGDAVGYAPTGAGPAHIELGYIEGFTDKRVRVRLLTTQYRQELRTLKPNTLVQLVSALALCDKLR